MKRSMKIAALLVAAVAGAEQLRGTPPPAQSFAETHSSGSSATHKTNYDGESNKGGKVVNVKLNSELQLSAEPRPSTQSFTAIKQSGSSATHKTNYDGESNSKGKVVNVKLNSELQLSAKPQASEFSEVKGKKTKHDKHDSQGSLVTATVQDNYDGEGDNSRGKVVKVPLQAE
eukprot:TRINITY_DN532_c0_g1_i1.p1 TRINITY_DN532_c0_g1~~TRINITY_DN532_c0_g1_i1.p1  ORF type:complete len:173 (-),score=44.42 TRINITY_DN532_c0_g1_i1:182-700(-)